MTARDITVDNFDAADDGLESIRRHVNSVARALLIADDIGIYPKDLATAIMREAGDPRRARDLAEQLRATAGELAGLLGDVAPAVATGDEDMQLRTTEAER